MSLQSRKSRYIFLAFAGVILFWPTGHAAAQECKVAPTFYGPAYSLYVPLLVDDYTIFLNASGQVTRIEVEYGNGRIETFAEGQDAAAFLADWCPGGIAFPRVARANAARSNWQFGQAPQGVAIGDFNGDGIGDNALLSSQGVTITLFNADGSILATHGYVFSAPTQAGIVAADFNGDGKIDLAILLAPAGSSGNGSIALMLGNGDGTFQSPATIALPFYPVMFAMADFNGDGEPDLSVFGASVGNGVQGPPQIATLLGNGDGTFKAPVLITGKFDNALSMVAVDLTGDGKPDLALATIPGSVLGVDQLVVYPGNGDGTFGSPVQTPMGTNSAYLTYADLNNDGKLDFMVLAPDRSELNIMLGNGDGTFQAPVTYAAPGEVASMTTVPLSDSTALILADAQAGALVFAFSDFTGKVSLPTVQTIGAPYSNSPAFPTVIAADLNGDQKPDVVVTGPAGVIVELNTGSATFSSPVTYQAGTTPSASAAADVNKDGKPDLLVANATGVTVLLNNGSGAFQAGANVATGSAQAITVADFNGDGNPDFAVTAPSSSGIGATISVALGTGSGAFGSPKAFASSGGSGSNIASGDFNGDGKPDLVDGSALYLGNGDGTFGAPRVLPASGVYVAAGDLNGDGKLDVVVASPTLPQISVMLGNGDGTFQTAANIPTATVTSITIADVDGDGKPDLVLGNCCGRSSEASYLPGNGDGTFGTETFLLTGPNPGSTAVADFFGSGLPSIAVPGYYGYSTDTTTLAIVEAASAPATQTMTVLSSANPKAATIAPGSLVSAYGTDLASSTPGSTSLPLPVTDAGTTVSIKDSAGAVTAAPLVYVSPKQVNFLLPSTVATGAAQVTISSGDGTQSAANATIAAVAPGAFTLNAAGLAAADVLLISGSSQTYENVYAVSGGALVSNPVSLGSATDTAYLILYGTGFEAAGTTGVKVTIGGISCTVVYAGPQGGFQGLDQANVVIPASLAGAGTVAIQLTANGIAANGVNLTIQ